MKFSRQPLERFEVEVSRLVVPDMIRLLRRHELEEDATALDDTIERYGAKTVTLVVGNWSKKLIAEALEILGDETKARAYLRGLLHIKENPTTAKVTKLELVPQALYRYLAADAIDGWIYREITDGVHAAYVVKRITYYPSDSYNRNPAYVHVSLLANRCKFMGEESTGEDDGQEEDSIIFYIDTLRRGNTASKLMLQSGYLKETKELKAAYLKELELFKQYHPRHSAQFLCTKTAVDVGDNGHSSNWWRTDARYPLPYPTKMVNEEEILQRKITLECDNSEWYPYGIKPVDKKFATIPVHPFMLFFDLSRHTHCWVHVLNCKPYVYTPSLRDKLVLPTNHRDLIDVLTEDMDVFVEDIIEGKSGGTPILCYGEPGLGKSLTAEVYSEVVGRPLYRVQAGQLGTDVQDVEKNLETILRRSERWKAVLLLDEADVYIRRRGNDLHHNAVVAAFLRTLEYFHGLMFLTTNRIGDVDDAIASRMVATFKYEKPDAESAKAIWKILSTQFGISLGEKAIEALVQQFPDASGRDIKQLLKLTMKFCKRKERKMNIEAFRICAMFRGIA